MIVNTTEGRTAIADSYAIRREALMQGVTYTTTLAGGLATCMAMDHRKVKEVYSLQGLHS
jgi:carbamoyl-phosphate synthase large subunit